MIIKCQVSVSSLLSQSSADVIMIIKCQVSVSSLLLGIRKAKKRKITSAE